MKLSIAVGLAVVGTTVGAFVVVTGQTEWRGDVRSPADPVSIDGLTERAECAEPTTPTTTLNPATPQAAQNARLTVRPTAIVDVNNGIIVAAMTNTGCAPRATDQLYFRTSEGLFGPLTPGSFDGVEWVGDFTRPDVPVSQ